MADLLVGDARITLADLEQRGARAARRLSAQVSPGTPVALLLRNEAIFVEALTTIRALSARRIVLPWTYLPADVGRVLTESGTRLLIAHADLLQGMAAVLATVPNLTVVQAPPADETLTAFGLSRDLACLHPQWVQWQDLTADGVEPLAVPPGAPQAISLTSGSTGDPRIIEVLGPQPWAAWNVRRGPERPPVQVSLVTAPLYFGGQYGIFSQAWGARADIVLMPKFDAESFLALVDRHRVNHAYVVPTMFTRLLRLPAAIRNRYDLSSLNYLIHTGAPCPIEVKRQIIDWLGPIVWESYGTTETATISACSSAEWLERPGTAGRPTRPVYILDADDQPLPHNHEGRIVVDVSQMPPIACNGNVLPTIAVGAHACLPTGDIGHIDTDGYLFVAERSDDLINTGRVKVYPSEIESAILEHPATLDCVVFAIPDAEFGQGIGATVQLTDTDPATRASLEAFLADRLTAYKVPTRLWTQTAPVRSATGKINRRAHAAVASA